MDGGLGPGQGRLRRADVRLRDGGHLGDRAPARHAALDRDRALPHGDRASTGRHAHRGARRAAGGHPERRPRSLGHPRLRPVGA